MGAEHQPVSYLDLYSQSSGATRDLVPVGGLPAESPESDKTAEAEDKAAAPPKPTRFARMTGGLSLRHLTPRQMAEVSLELYARGTLAYDEYELMAFQPELHPDYDITIGALTGEPANPDLPRDYVSQWEERLNFEQRHCPQNAARLRTTERIVHLLNKLDSLPQNGKDTIAA